MKKSILGLFLMIFIFSGCVVRTYSVQKERADLDLNSGNRGFLAGKSTAPATVAKTTRENKVVEIEMFPLIRSLKKDKTAPAVKPAAGKEELKPAEQTVPASQPQPVVPVVATVQDYTVQNGDTLQKISSKFYGTMHKWNKIYEANKDRLKGPDKLKPGQVLIIPADTRPQPVPAAKAAETRAPVENLK